MKIDFIGPASLGTDGGVVYVVTVDGKQIECAFTYEALEDVDPETVFGDPLEHFSTHKLVLLSAAEKKILKGLTHNGKLLVNSGDIRID